MGGWAALLPIGSYTGKGIMKKRVVAGGAVLAAAAIWTGTAWYTGKRIEERLAQDVQALDAQVQRLGKKLGIPVALELLSFERGVFSSTARFGLKATTQSGGNPAQERDFQFTGKVDHGPFPTSRLAAGQFAPAMAAGAVQMAQTPDASGWFKAAGGVAPVSARFVFGYDRDVSGGLDLAPVEYVDGLDTLSFSGLKGLANIAGDGRRSGLSLAFDKLALIESIKGGNKGDNEGDNKGDNEGDNADGRWRKLAVQGFAVTHESTAADAGASKSNTKVTAKEWLADMDQLPLGMKDIALTVDADTASMRMNGKLGLDVGSISVKGRHVAKLRMVLGGKDMDVEALNAFRDFYESVPQPREGALPVLPDQLTAASYMVKFLLARPSFSISPLQVESAGGTSSLSLDIGLDSPSFWNRDPAGIAKEVVRNLSMRLKLSTEGVADLVAARLELKGASPEIAREAARREAEAMRSLIAEKQWGRIDNGTIQVEADYRDGQLDFNGERMPVEAFIGRALAH